MRIESRYFAINTLLLQFLAPLYQPFSRPQEPNKREKNNLSQEINEGLFLWNAQDEHNLLTICTFTFLNSLKNASFSFFVKKKDLKYQCLNETLWRNFSQQSFPFIHLQLNPKNCFLWTLNQYRFPLQRFYFDATAIRIPSGYPVKHLWTRVLRGIRTAAGVWLLFSTQKITFARQEDSFLEEKLLLKCFWQRSWCETKYLNWHLRKKNTLWT